MPQTYNRAPAKPRRSLAFVGITSLAAAILLSACQSNTTLSEGIGFRQARFQEISAMESYRGCIDDAMQMDEDARAKGNLGGYIASARLIEKCESNLGPEAAHLAIEERMRAYAIAIVNYTKGGDLSTAQKNLGKFKQSFGEYDLYLPNGASFVDTMALLTGERTVNSSYDLSILNIDQKVEAEFERLQYWQTN